MSSSLIFSSKSSRNKTNFRKIPKKQQEQPLKQQYVIRNHQKREYFFLMAMLVTET